MKRVVIAACIAASIFKVDAQTIAQSEKVKMDKFITELMSKMTIEEKIGQLNFPGGGDVTTGQAKTAILQIR